MARATSASKSAAKKAPPKKTARKAPARKPRGGAKVAEPPSRTIPMVEEDDGMFSRGGGAVSGSGFGRCGGRILGSSLEQVLCNHLTGRGIAHSHTPLYFEVRLEDGKRAAYTPLMVLRGRGREGKTVVVECLESMDRSLLKKIQAFRDQYGAEFYLVFVAEEELLDELPLSAYDEATDLQHINSLIARLAAYNSQ